MTQREYSTPKLNLTRQSDQPPLRIGMETFFDFTFWLAEELQDLEARFDSNRNKAGFDCDIPWPDDMQQVDWY